MRRLQQTILFGCLCLLLVFLVADPSLADEVGSSSGSTNKLLDILLKLAQSLARAFLAFAPLIGAIMIFKGIQRFMEGNHGPHQGKGAFVKITIGACLLLPKLLASIVLNTLAKCGFPVDGARAALGI